MPISAVWATKYRKRVLMFLHEREYGEQVLRRAAAEYGMNIESIEVDGDHVHLYMKIAPQRSVGRAVGIFKIVSSRLMFKIFSYFRRKLWAGGAMGPTLLCAHSKGRSDGGHGPKIHRRSRRKGLGACAGSAFFN
ncbi:MAG: IS200/IS605 family transposase [Bdellovibrionales bacterium]